jgi:hypothetical protein
MDLRDTLLAIERRLWTNDADYYEANLTPDALLVFAETGVITRDVAFAAIRKENAEGRRWEKAELSDLRMRPLTTTTALLCCRANASWVNDATVYSALCSSVYVNHSDAWRLALHQQSKIEG